MRGAKRVDHWSVTAGSRAAQRGLAVQVIGEAKPRAEASIVIRRQSMGARSSRSVAGEYQRAQTSVRPGIGHARIEIAEDVISVDRGQVDLIPQAEVQCQMLGRMPVVLKIHLVSPVLSGDVPVG